MYSVQCHTPLNVASTHLHIDIDMFECKVIGKPPDMYCKYMIRRQDSTASFHLHATVPVFGFIPDDLPPSSPESIDDKSHSTLERAANQ